LRFTVVQVFPECRRIGSFALLGLAGTNRVRLGPRLHGRLLRPGTYEVGTIAAHGTLLRTTIAIFASRRPTAATIKRALDRSSCTRTWRGGPPLATGNSSLGVPLALSSRSEQTHGGGQLPSALGGDLGLNSSPRAQLAKNFPESPLGILLFIVAGTLLGFAVLPRKALPHDRLASAIARRRVELAGSGLALLIGDLIVLALG
jgi:hypothetical protein